MTAQLNHIALTVFDREISASFYARYFGLDQRVHEDDHLLIVSNGIGALLALSAGEVGAHGPRTTHFGFQLDDVEQVLKLRSRFNADGVVEAEFQMSGPTRVQAFDPDGYRVEAYAF